jgi:hypothetical protein
LSLEEYQGPLDGLNLFICGFQAVTFMVVLRLVLSEMSKQERV